MNKIARFLAQRCLSSGIIGADMLDWCVYSIERRLVTFVTWAVLLGAGSALFGFLPSLLFTGCLLFIRSRTNGYHASGYWACMFLSLGMELGCLCLSACLPQHAAILLMLAADAVIWVFAPCNDPKIHLDEEELLVLKESARRRLALLNGGYLLAALHRPLSNCIAAAVIADAVSLFIAKNNRKTVWKTEVSIMKNEFKQLVQEYVQNIVNRDAAKRAPDCIGWFYQPARPVQKDEKV